jgi:hypothetical protein
MSETDVRPTILERAALRILRRKKIRVDITCPHGTFVPAHHAIASRHAKMCCHRCDFAVKVALVDDPYRDGPQ